MHNNIIRTKLSHIVQIPKIKDEGFLYFAESENHVPFMIKRMYFIADVDKNAVRGKHAHKKTQQLLFCIQGSVTIVLDNGSEKEEVTLKSAKHGIFLNKMMWHEMKSFTKDTILLVLASEYFEEADYIRDYTKFLQATRKTGHMGRGVFLSFAMKYVRRNIL